MIRTRKQLASAVLALILCLSLAPGALAEEPDPILGPFTITFDAAGGVFPDGRSVINVQTEDHGGAYVTPPPDPTREGYTFAGWSVEAVWNCRFTADGTVHARWTAAEEAPPSYTVILDANGGLFHDGSLTITAKTQYVNGKNIIVPQFADPMEREGWYFDGWCLAGQEQPLFRGTNLEIWKAMESYSFTSDSRLFARWIKGSSAVTVRFRTNYEGGESIPDQVIPMGGKLSYLPTPKARPGYTFTGWFWVSSDYNSDQALAPDGLHVIVSASTDYTRNTTLYAGWLQDAVPDDGIHVREVWFHLNGGTVTSVLGIKPNSAGAVIDGDGKEIFWQRPDDGEEILGEMLTDENGKLPGLPVIQRSGYVFDGWYTMENGGNKVSADMVFRGSGQWGRDYLWAHWRKASGTVTVTFDLNTGKGKVPAPQIIPLGGTVSLPSAKGLTPPRDNLVFYAWGYLNSSRKLVRWDENDPVTADLTLYAGWVEKSAGSAAQETPKISFTDVAETSPFASAISWAVQKEITNGTGDGTTFSPGVTCTRAHILTFLWRSQGSPEPTIENPFTDSIPAAFQKAAIWAYEKGLVSGAEFGASTPCTRESSVTYMWKLAGSPKAKASSFKDVSSDAAYAQAIDWAVEQGVTNGTGDGTTFSPSTTCTRGQIVTFLFRAYAEKS